MAFRQVRRVAAWRDRNLHFFQRQLSRVADLTLFRKVAARVSVVSKVSEWKLWIIAADLRLRYGKA